MKIFLIAWKTLIETWRDRQLLLIYLLFPTAMILIYFAAFGQTISMAGYLNVIVDNRDRGESGAEFVLALREATFEGQPVFTLQERVAADVAEIVLQEGKAALLLTIPPDFSAAIRGAQGAQAAVDLYGDPLTDTYVFARSFLGQALRDFVDIQTGRPPAQPVRYEFLPNTGKMNDFQFGVPGLLVFGVLFGTVSSALMLVREASHGTLRRIRLSGVSGADVLGGITLANLTMALTQAALSLAVARACGFTSPGSLLLAAGIALGLSLGASGCGFIAASFSHSEGEATAIGTGFMVPQVFLSGAIFPMPVLSLFKLGGRTVQLYELMPSTHASEAMRRVLVLGDPASSLWYELGMLLGLSLLLLALGVWLYQRRMLRA